MRCVACQRTMPRDTRECPYCGCPVFTHHKLLPHLRASVEEHEVADVAKTKPPSYLFAYLKYRAWLPVDILLWLAVGFLLGGLLPEEGHVVWGVIVWLALVNRYLVFRLLVASPLWLMAWRRMFRTTS